MALEVTDRKDNPMPFKSDRALYLNADKTEVVAEGDPNAAFLLVGAGSEIDDADAEKYGLKSSSKAEDKAVAAPEEDKADEPDPAPVKATKATKAAKKSK